VSPQGPHLYRSAILGFRQAQLLGIVPALFIRLLISELRASVSSKTITVPGRIRCGWSKDLVQPDQNSTAPLRSSNSCFSGEGADGFPEMTGNQLTVQFARHRCNPFYPMTPK
jgi:hypothetical protein